MLLTEGEYSFIQESNAIEGEEGVDFDHLDAFMEMKKTVLFNERRKLICESIIGTIHTWIMQNKLTEKHRGVYRTTAVQLIGPQGIYKMLPNPAVIPALMDAWIVSFNKKEKTPWEYHKEFENIHPFIDGNGRTGRLLWAWDLLRRGEDVRPMLDDFKLTDYTKGEDNTFESTRQRYYKALD